MRESRDLYALIEIAKQEENETNGSESAQTSVIHILAEAGGALPINDLLTRYGVSKRTIEALVDPDLTGINGVKLGRKLEQLMTNQSFIFLPRA